MADFSPLVGVGSQSSKLSGVYNSTGDLSVFLNRFFGFAITIGAMAAVLRIAYAGYLYLGQADMWSHKGEARKIIGDVTFGLLLLLAVWLILYQINPDMLKLNALEHIRKPSVVAPGSSSGAPTPAGRPGFVQLQ